MKKLLLAFVAMLLPLTACAEQTYKEGEHYRVIRQQATPEPQVMEFFSILCGHCYNFEHLVHKMTAQLPENVEFKRNHVDFVGRKVGNHYTRAFATSVVVGEEEKVLPLLFDEVHRKKNYMQSPESIRAKLVDNGIDGAAYDAAINSFAVNGLVSQMQKNTSKFQIRGVPTFIVNGKYQILFGDNGIDNSESFNSLVNYLLTKK